MIFWVTFLLQIFSPPHIFVWIFTTFDYNFEYENDLTKYLKESG